MIYTFYFLYFLGFVRSTIAFTNITMTPIKTIAVKNVLVWVWVAFLFLGHYLAWHAWSSGVFYYRAVAAVWFAFFPFLTLQLIYKSVKEHYFGKPKKHEVVEIRDISAGLKPIPSRDLFEAPRHWLRRLGRHNDFFYPIFLEQTIYFKHLPPAFDGFTFLHITDIHFRSGRWEAYYQQLLDWIIQLDTKVMFITGDFVSRRRDIPGCAAWLKKMAVKLEVYGILGNHDYWTSHHSVVEELTSAGVKMLVNEAVMLNRGRQQVEIIGLDDRWKGRRTPKEIWGNKTFKIVLAHTPDHAKVIKKKGADFILSGHTHAGQIRFPVLGPIFIPSSSSRKFDRGYFRVGKKLLLYVNQGIGGTPPVRINCRPEVSKFVLRRER